MQPDACIHELFSCLNEDQLSNNYYNSLGSAGLLGPIHRLLSRLRGDKLVTRTFDEVNEFVTIKPWTHGRRL